MINEYNMKIINNKNNGDIIVNVNEQIICDASYWISKGNICLKNLNYEGAFECFYNATFFECTEEQLYYCYNKLLVLTQDYEEKYNFLKKIFKLKTVKKNKIDIFRYILIHVIIFSKANPYTILLFIIVILKFIL